jgi:DNA-binding SARP family transcriptional activator/tetratricopeptide (TPR) repeat protein
MAGAVVVGCERTVRFGLLGPLRVVDAAGTAWPVRAGKQRIVLAALLLSNGTAISAEELAEALWDVSAPPNASAVMRTYVMRLRRALGPAGTRVIRRAGGWAVSLGGPEELDLAEVDHLWRAARAAGESQDWRRVSALLAQALSRWRGEPLIDVPSPVLIRREAGRLGELRLQLTEARIDADLRLGGHAGVVAELRRLTAEHPLREHFRVQLMLACYRGGHQGAALEVYREAHRMLAEELGVAPGPELQEIHQRILAADPGLTVVPAGKVTLGEPVQRLPAGPEPSGFRHGLPPDTAAFTGRDAQLELITGGRAAGAAGGGVVAIQAINGMPGVGKTTLAVHAAHELAAAFPDRQMFIDLHGHTPGRDPISPADALAELLSAAGADARFLPADLASRSAMWRDKMAGQRALLVLDNAASSAQVAPLLPGGNCLVLVTGRRQLADLPGAVVPVTLGTLPAGQARTMFVRLAPYAAGEDPALVDELTELAGHLPLAISVLARVHARHPSWTLADLIAETRDSLLALTAEHTSVAAAFTVSWRHLDSGPRRMLTKLGLHPGTSTDPHAAAALAGVTAGEAARQLDDLHRECLLTETGYRRYRLHDLTRSYAAAQAATLLTAAEADAAVSRLLDYYTRAAARADTLISGRGTVEPGEEVIPGIADSAGAQAGARAWTRAERANLLACLGYATAAGRRSEVVALTTAITGLLRRDGPWPHAVALHAAAAEAAGALGDRPALARCLLNLGAARRLSGEYQAASDDLAGALRLYRELADRSGEAAALRELGYVHLLTDDYPAAAGFVGAALRIYRDIGDRSGQGSALILTASVSRRADEFQAASAALTQALEICRDLDDRPGQAHALRQLGDVRRLTSDYDGAARYLQEALEISRELDDQAETAHALTWLAGVRRLTGDYEGAIRDLEQALDIQGRLGNRNGRANALTLLGDARQASGDHRAAISDLEHALRLYQDLGSPAGEASALGWLGGARLAAGDYPAAAADLARSLSICIRIGDRGGQATGLNQLGKLHLARGDITQARELHRKALDLARQIDSTWDEAHALTGLGRCARASGGSADAARLLTQAYQIFLRTGEAEAAVVAAELE